MRNSLRYFNAYDRNDIKNFRKVDAWSYKDISIVENIDKLKTKMFVFNSIENSAVRNDQFFRLRRKMSSAKKDFFFVDYTSEENTVKNEHRLEDMMIHLNQFFKDHIKH